MKKSKTLKLISMRDTLIAAFPGVYLKRRIKTTAEDSPDSLVKQITFKQIFVESTSLTTDVDVVTQRPTQFLFEMKVPGFLFLHQVFVFFSFFWITQKSDKNSFYSGSQLKWNTSF